MKQRILVVDDDKLVADTLSMVFIANGFEAEASYSAAAALDRARTFEPSMMVCDVTMPQRNGLELVQDMDREMPNCKILMLTAYASNLAKVGEQSQRMRRPLSVLSKPCRPEVLLQELHSLMRSA